MEAAADLPKDPAPPLDERSQLMPIEPRQRWRLTFARAEDPLRRTHREIVDAWLAVLVIADLPLPRSAGRPKGPLTFAAPLPAGIACRAEVADLLLSERRPAWWVRERLLPTMPAGTDLVRLDDVWLGAPALAATIRAAVYAIPLLETAQQHGSIGEAAARFLAAPRLERERARGSGTVRYDLRPLVDDILLQPGPPPLLLIRTLFQQDRGTGRPDEVLAALADLRGAPILVGSVVRERLILDA